LGSVAGKLSSALNNITSDQSGGAFDNVRQLEHFADSLSSLADDEQQAAASSARLGYELISVDVTVSRAKTSAGDALNNCFTLACDAFRDEVSYRNTHSTYGKRI
jgi:hypothetical protein